MNPIGHRHLQRRLRAALQAQASAEAALQTLQTQVVQQQSLAANQVSTLLQTMSTAILAEDQNRIVTLVNQSLCTLFGLTLPPAAYIGQPCMELMAQSAIRFRHPLQILEQTEAAIAGQERVTGLLVALENQRVLQQDYLPVVQDGHTVLHLWSYEDVTRQQQAQQRIRDLSRLAEQSPHPTIHFRHDGVPFFANTAAEPVLRALAQPEAKELQSLLRSEIYQALAEKQPRTFEQRLNGQFFLWTVAPIQPADGANVYLTDISDRRRAEAELLRSQLFVARINDTIPNLVYVFDLEHRRLSYCNRQAQSMLGYSEAELIALGDQFLPTLLTPEGMEHANSRQAYFLDLVDGSPMSTEYEVRHRDGSRRFMRVQTTAFTRRRDGTVGQIICCAEDVTEQRGIKEKLRHSQLLVERVAETVPNLIYIYDLHGRQLLYANQLINKIIGYTTESFQALGGDGLTQLLPATETARMMAYLKQVKGLKDGESLTFECFVHHRDRSVRWLRLTNTPYERDDQGRVKLIVGSAEDITEWKVAEEERRIANLRLAEQNRLFRQVIDATPHLIYLKDGDGNYLLANQATADLYGISTEEIVRMLSHHRLGDQAEAARTLRHDREVIRTGQQLTHEVLFTRPDGQVMSFLSIKRPFVLADGTVQVLGVDSNITELKRIQVELREAKEVAEANARTKQDFLTNMSHEIRTPMNGVLGMAGLLGKTSLDEQQSQYLSHIHNSAENLLVVINDILDMAQLSSGKIRLEATTFDVREVLRASRQLLLPKADEKGIRLELELPSADVPTLVKGDPYRLRQVVLNLLSNAVKFTDHGRVLLTCRRVSGPGGDPEFAFAVLDTGIGIPEHQLAAVFESFTQASASTARQYGGSGLGLSISKSLVELLGGHIEAESRLGQGSAFRFTLPFAPAEPAPVVSASPAPDFRSLGPRRVLMAEDNPVNQYLVEFLLRGWGMHIDTAATGAEAVELFNQHTYDIVLMDIQMPGLDGVATTKLLRSHPDAQRAATPVVALTAHTLRDEADRYRAAGLNGYLSKPFREEQLFHAMADLLQSPLKSAPATPSPAEGREAAEPLYDLSGIRRLVHGNEAFVQRLVHLFVQTTPSCVRELEEHLAGQNWKALASTAHNLKSSLDGMLVRQLHTVIRRLEACTTGAPNPEVLTDLVAHVRHVTEQTIEQLQQEFSEL